MPMSAMMTLQTGFRKLSSLPAGPCGRGLLWKTAGPAVGVALPYRASHKLDTSVQVSYAVPCRERAIGPSPCLIYDQLSLYEALATRGFLSSDNKRPANPLLGFN